MNLSQLGLTAYEAQAFTALVQRGPSPASSVSKESGVPYGRVYDVLADLERKGLVVVLPEKTKKFAPAPLDAIEQLVSEQQAKLDKLKEEVSTLKQLYEQQAQQPVIISRGKSNFYRVIKQMPDIETYNYSIKHNAEPRLDWMIKDQERLRAGKDLKSLTRYDEETKDNVDQWLAYQPQHKVFDNQGVAMSIREGAVMIALIKNSTTLLIQDKAFVDVMRRLFLAAYEAAPNVPTK